MKTYTLTVEEKDLGVRTFAGMEFAQMTTRVIIQVESETKPTLREIAAMLEPEVAP
jgi:hypothetical protein